VVILQGCGEGEDVGEGGFMGGLGVGGEGVQGRGLAGEGGEVVCEGGEVRDDGGLDGKVKGQGGRVGEVKRCAGAHRVGRGNSGLTAGSFGRK
jgi:hypothetical protein